MSTRLRVVNLGDKKVSTLSIAGLEPPKEQAKSASTKLLTGAAEERMEPVTLRPENGVVRLTVDLQLPTGSKINPSAPMSYRSEPGSPQSTVPLKH